MPHTVLYHPLALNPCALDIRHQLIKILVEWQITSKNTYPTIGHWAVVLNNETVNLIAAVKPQV
jgi:hypothetical protein